MTLTQLLPAPLRRTLDLLSAMSARSSEVNTGLVSAGVAFYGLFAIFPTLTAIVALWGLVADPAVVAEEVKVIEPMVPEEGFDIIERQVNALTSGAATTLGWASAVSLLGAFWASRSGVAALIGALNKVHRAKPRGGIWHVMTALALSSSLIVAALVALASVVVAPVALAFLPLGPYAGSALSVLRWVMGGAIVLVAIGALYRFGPAKKEAPPRWRWAGVVTPGALLAVALWGSASWAFSTYLANFGNYDKVYGSLGAVIALLMWFYISAYVVVLGSIFDVELSRRGDAEGAAPSSAGDPSPDGAPSDAAPSADQGPERPSAVASAGGRADTPAEEPDAARIQPPGPTDTGGPDAVPGPKRARLP
ncbi:MAG: YhjD/YihY/BrkB family envelope integrity protein [Pseudomonadota bacterium]